MFPLRISAYLLNRVKDFQLKEQLLQSFFAGLSRTEIGEHTDWFCRNWLPKNLHPVGQRCLKTHLDQGHRIVMLSASPDLYVPAIASSFGIHESICTRVEFHGERCTGRLVGDNCKGDQKLTAIKHYLGWDQPQTESFAYGDSKHDLPLLNWVDRGMLVKAREAIVVKKH